MAQAATTRDALQDDAFDALFVSPLRRARETAEIITSGRTPALAPRVLPALREVDLFSFQGLVKAEGKARFGEQYKQWQQAPAAFEIDGHAPVRELWYRASLGWQHILGSAPAPGDALEADGGGGGGDGGGAGAGTGGRAASGRACGCSLVVAHNAVNQALIATALALPPAYFRRLLQSNAATTVLDFAPSLSGGPPRVTLDRLNQSPGRPYAPDSEGRESRGRVVLVRHGATASTQGGVLLGATGGGGPGDEALSALGLVQAGKAAELLLDMKVDTVLTSPARRCTATATLVAELQQQRSAGGAGSGPPAPPRLLMLQELENLDVGGWQGRPLRLLRGQPLPADAEQLLPFWERTRGAWQRVLDAAAEGSGSNVAVVSHAAVHAALVAHCLGLGPDAISALRFDTGSVSIIDFPDGPRGGPGVARCLNFTAHLGRWAVPIQRDDLDAVCYLDGCF